MDKFLSGLLGWLGIAFVAYFGIVLAALVGFVLHSVATAFCPDPDMASGVCTAPWFAWAEQGITLIVAALAGALVVLFAAGAAERPQRRQAATAALVIGSVMSIMLANSSGPADGDLVLETLLAIGCGVLALYRVHVQLDPAWRKAKYEARKTARKAASKNARAENRKKKSHRGWGRAARQYRKTAQRGVPRLAASGRRHRRRLHPSLDPASPSPAIGKAAMATFVLLGLWFVFMVLVIIFHHPGGSEAEALRSMENMFSWWMFTAFLTMLLLAVEMAASASISPARNLRRLATNLLALIMATLMLATNAQFSRLYYMEYWQREYAHVPSYAVRGDFSYPSILVPGSNANKEWLEFQEFIDWKMFGATAVRLDFQPEQPVRLLAQCTPELWRSPCNEIRFRVGDGPEHILYSPWSRHYYDVLLPPQDGNLEELVLLGGLNTESFLDQVEPQVDVGKIPAAGPVTAEELDELLEQSFDTNSLKILVPRNATVEWLDILLRGLEERGADSFILIFYG